MQQTTTNSFMVVFAIGISLCLTVLGYLGVRALAKAACRDRWKIRYVRWSVDTALTGCILLCITSKVAGSLETSLSLGEQAMDKLSMSSIQEGSPLWGLVECKSMLWFIEYFPLFVIVPAGLVLLGGYTIERSKSERKRSDDLR
jgi:hypothetical protein